MLLGQAAAEQQLQTFMNPTRMAATAELRDLAHRQVSECTRHRVCHCQQAAFSLE